MLGLCIEATALEVEEHVVLCPLYVVRRLDISRIARLIEIGSIEDTFPILIATLKIHWLIHRRPIVW